MPQEHHRELINNFASIKSVSVWYEFYSANENHIKNVQVVDMFRIVDFIKVNAFTKLVN